MKIAAITKALAMMTPHSHARALQLQFALQDVHIVAMVTSTLMSISGIVAHEKHE